MADKKPFNFEDWMAMRKEQLPSITSPYRKKFDLTPNTWMEDPGIWSRAKKAAELDPSFAKQLALNANNPEFTEQFISRLDDLVPQVSLEQAEKVAKSEIGGELSDLLSKRVENLRRTTIPQAGTPDAEELVKLSSRYSSPRILSESPTEVQKILGIKSYAPKDIESVVGKSISETQLDPASRYASGRVIPGGSPQLDEILGVKSYTPKDIEFKGFDIVQGPQASSSVIDNEAIKKEFLKDLEQRQARKAIESGRFETKGPAISSGPSPQELKTKFALEKNPPAMVEGPMPAPETPSPSALKEGLKAQKAAAFRAGLTNDFEALQPIIGDLTEELGRSPSGREVLDALVKAGSKGGSKALELGGKVLTSPPVKMLGKAIPPVVALAEGARTYGNIKRGEYADALGSGLGAASGVATMMKSPYALPLAAGSLAIAGGKELGKQQAELADEGIFYDPSSGMSRSEVELPESVRKAPMTVLKKPEPEIEPIEISSEKFNVDEDIDKQIDELMKSEEPAPTEPTPVEPGLDVGVSEEPVSATKKPSSGFANKMMDILGMPSAYAEEMPSKELAPKPRINIPKHLIKNMIYSESLKNKMPPALVLAVLSQESGDFNLNDPNVVKNKDSSSRGVSQVTADTFSEIQKISPYFKNKKHEDLSNMSSAAAIRDQIRSGIAALKVKAREAKIPFTEENLKNPKVQEILLKRYRGHKNPKVNEQYANIVRQKMGEYENVLNAYDKNKTSEENKDKSFFTRALEGMAIVGRDGRPLPKSNKITSLPFMPEISKDVVPASEEPSESPEQQQIIDEINQIDDGLKNLQESDTSGKEDGGLSAIELMQKMQDQSQKDKVMELQALKNYLQAAPMAAMAKGATLLASGLIGAGPKQKFITIPEAKGMETFDTLAQAPAAQLKTMEYLKSSRMDDPSSPESQTYRKYAASIMKSVNPDFNETSLMGLSANSIKTLLPMGIKEDSLLLRKLGMEGRKEKEQIATTLKQAKENRLLQRDAVAKFDKDTKDEKIKINGAIQAKSLIKKIRSTDLKDRLTASKNMRNTLTLEALRLATPAGLNVLAGDRQAAAIDTLYGDIKDKIGYLFSMPTETITDQYLDQLSTEIDLLQNKYKEFFVKKTDGILSAYDNPVQQKAIKSLAKQYAPDVYGEKEAEGAEKPAAKETTPVSGQKVVVRKGYNPKLNKTQLIYSDGTKEIVDGKQ